MVGREEKAAAGGCTEVVIKEPCYVPPVTGTVMMNDDGECRMVCHSGTALVMR